LFFDATNRQPGWETTIRRNDWFQRRQLAWLRANEDVLTAGPPGVFFAYSYAARELLRFFKNAGWKTVLGQIDPGPREEEIVAEEAARFPESRGRWNRAPERYWTAWREELGLADRILVNSEWSKECLGLDGGLAGKVFVVPLAYEQSGQRAAERRMPVAFSRERPLRVLFLGQVNLRKGAHHLLEAARRIAGEPVEFHFVGPVEIARPTATAANVVWHGAVSREEAARYYAASDVFALPTLSDGFALTQLEALSHGLPLIVTKNCARVVEHGRNGWTLPSPSANEIVALLRRLVASPADVANCTAGARVPEAFSPASLRSELQRVEESLA
jgi:glycosyltransferase involved in cell wall biosynthesis